MHRMSQQVTRVSETVAPTDSSQIGSENLLPPWEQVL